jgi:predicted ATPase/DNA-binding CsgD family transcriptional regulator
MLFMERARAARPDFRVTTENAAAIVEVCRRLDGVPLALELAATRVRLLSIEQIAARLDDQLRLLAGGRRTAPSRQQTLRATLDWSYVLLQEPQRRLFNRLAVFARSWTLEAAEAICGDDAVNRDEVLDLLAQLIDQSLVVAEEQSGRVRYGLLDTMRQYAAEKLEESGESPVMRDRHLDWFLTQAESSPFELMDPDHIAWLAEEVDNLRSALRWSIQRGAVESGLRLAIRACAFWYQYGFYAEGCAWLAEVLAQTEALRTVARATALIWAAQLTKLRGDVPAALALARESLAIARELDDAGAFAESLWCEAQIALRTGDAARAQSLLEESLSVCRDNRLSRAGLEYYILHGLALLALETGDSARAATIGAECQELAQRIGHVRGSANTMYVLGRAAAMRGDCANGRRLLESGLALYRQYTDWQGTEWCLRALGYVALEQGDLPAARRFFREDLGFAQASGEALELALGLEGLAGTLVVGQPDRAVRLVAAAAVLREAVDARPYASERERLDRWLEAAAAKLGHEAYTAAWAEGRAMPQEQVFVLARAPDDEPSSQQSFRAKGDALSPRECEVVRLVAAGRTNRQIAEHLVIAPRTADTHVGNILTKLDLHTRAELAVWAVENGLSRLDPTNAPVAE